nr:MAG TPA: hypothetical protein [Caudoviricetes sp.]
MDDGVLFGGFFSSQSDLTALFFTMKRAFAKRVFSNT